MTLGHLSGSAACLPADPFLLARRYCDEEGTVLLYSGDGVGVSYLALFPDRRIEVPLGPHCWEELEALIGDDLYFGFLTYEMGCYSTRQIAHAAAARGALFYRPTVVVRFDHQTGAVTQFGKGELKVGVRRAFTAKKREHSSGFREKVQLIKEQIRLGNVYQANLSQNVRFSTQGSPFALFEQVAPGHPYSAYVRTDNETLVSASPELFVERKGACLRTRPIKGTAPRGENEAEEKRLRDTLLHSPKERAELMMIVDLLRNDLSLICSKVEVEKLCELESYPTVFHLVSTVKGILKEQHPIRLLRPLFPGGSITGCPKLAAMELIHQLEESARGVYTGAIGFIDGAQQMQLNLAIRTAVIEGEEMNLRLGSGIVADSDPDREYEETEHKGKRFLCPSSTAREDFNMRTELPSLCLTEAFSTEMASSPR